MPTRQEPALDIYLAELVRLRALTLEGVAEEMEDKAPLWVSLRVVTKV